MAEKLAEVLEQYKIAPVSISRGRGAYFCRTEEGLYKLELFAGSERRLLREHEIKERLYQAGFQNIDRYIEVDWEGEEYSYKDQLLPDQIGADHLIAADRYRNAYTLKKYFDGCECDLKNELEVGLAVNNLGVFHKVGAELAGKDQVKMRSKSVETFVRHNQELKRVRNFISRQNHKNDFEMKYLGLFSYFYDRALQSEERLKQSQACDNPLRLGLCHGAYHQHNVLILKEGVATVSFEQFHYDNQLTDLYSFTRKLLEKNHFQYSCFVRALEEYEKIQELCMQDYLYLYCLFSYPEKFWKLSNHYMNGNKAWMPPKTMEKLAGMVKAEQEKTEFLTEFQKDYGIPI